MIAFLPGVPLWVIVLVALVPSAWLAIVRVLRAVVPQDSSDRRKLWTDLMLHRRRVVADRRWWRREVRNDRRTDRLERARLRNRRDQCGDGKQQLERPEDE